MKESVVIDIEQIEEAHRPVAGGKALCLAQLKKAGFCVPDMVCATTRCYDRFVDATGLRERIMLELSRKDFADMRWEEVWDAALRIRNMFLVTPFPEDLRQMLTGPLEKRFSDTPVAVRSSAPGEDDKSSSFAGLHDSFLNVRGAESILEHVKLVWASLWSDSALLYRRELGLAVEKSAMAVVVQEIVAGDCSGVVFSQSPTDPASGVVESVYGLNQGLVDGAVAPDRWTLDRSARKIVSHTPAERTRFMVPGKTGVSTEKLPDRLAARPPLSDSEVIAVFDLALSSEKHFGSPQDLEWTRKDGHFHVLQSRPVSTVKSEDPDQKRTWYLSLHRSFENLKQLRAKIEERLIPEMIEAAKKLARIDLAKLSDGDLADEIQRRAQINDKWVGVYWEEFIPYAHGIRLFGQVYNDAVKPENPYEFIDLLSGAPMAGIERNRHMERLAAMVRHNPELAEKLKTLEPLSETIEQERDFLRSMEAFVESFGDLSCPVTGSRECSQGPAALIRLVLEMASQPPVKPTTKDASVLERNFLSRFDRDKRKEAEEILDLGRSSYRLRDDDNIHLGRIEARLMSALEEGKRRLEKRSADSPPSEEARKLKQAVENHRKAGPSVKSEVVSSGRKNVRARQLLGQPAANGVARGIARVVADHSQLADFKHGEILVCDAVDPNMTFVAPLAAGIVERRGGMLIHGAIIAREYGLACVTGVPDATTLIATGDFVTVDGFLGIVTIGKN